MMNQNRLLTLALAVALCTGSAAMARPAIVDAATPDPSSWLTTGCVLLLLTTMQRRR
jgi:hypothetical protein